MKKRIEESKEEIAIKIDNSKREIRNKIDSSKHSFKKKQMYLHNKEPVPNEHLHIWDWFLTVQVSLFCGIINLSNFIF